MTRGIFNLTSCQEVSTESFLSLKECTLAIIKKKTTECAFMHVCVSQNELSVCGSHNSSGKK